MISQKELQIGSYVLYDTMILPVTSINSPKPDKSERFNEKWAVELLCDGFIYCPIEDIKPIPLSEEILLKCGFVGKNNWFSKKGILLGYTTSDNFLQIEYRFSGGDWIVLDLKHLHQLQNLYYCLCGEELEVNL